MTLRQVQHSDPTQGAEQMTKSLREIELHAQNIEEDGMRELANAIRDRAALLKKRNHPNRLARLAKDAGYVEHLYFEVEVD